MNIREAIEKLVNRVSLSEAETSDVMNQIMTGEATPLQVASFLTALRMKGETVEEITGAARVMREKAHRVNVGRNRAGYLRHRRRSEALSTFPLHQLRRGGGGIAVAAATLSVSKPVRQRRRWRRWGRWTRRRSGSKTLPRSASASCSRRCSRGDEIYRPAAPHFVDIARCSILGPLTNPALAASIDRTLAAGWSRHRHSEPRQRARSWWFTAWRFG